MKHRRLLIGITLPLAIIVLAFGFVQGRSRGKLNYTAHLDSVAVTIDGEELTLSDLSFYVLFEECKVEGLARIYNPDSPKDYWNSYTNNAFVNEEAKKAILGMAIHDHIMYTLAKENSTVLNSDQKDALEKARTDFWNDLYDEQLTLLPLSYEDGNRVMKQVIIAEVYQGKLAKSMGVSYESLVWDGPEFEKLLKEHKVKVNERIWDRVVVGDISLVHENVNFINGLTNARREEIRNSK